MGLEGGEGEEGNPMGLLREVERMGVAERLAEMRGRDEGGRVREWRRVAWGKEGGEGGSGEGAGGRGVDG